MGNYSDIISMIDIKGTAGNTLFSVPIAENCAHHDEIMKAFYIKLFWNSDRNTIIPEGSYIEYEGDNYRLLEPYKPTRKGEIEYSYEPEFQHKTMLWDKKVLFFYQRDNEGMVIGRETDWSITDAPANIMLYIASAIAEETGETVTASVDSSLPASVSMQLHSSSIFGALNELANLCNTEWWLQEGVLHLSKCLYGDPFALEVGRNINVPNITNNKEAYYTRFYAFGSTRNITQDYDNGQTTNHIVQKRLSLNKTKYPGGYKDIRPNLRTEEVFVKTLIFDDVYPSADLSISDVRAEQKYHLDRDGNKVEIGKDEHDTPVYDMYNIWYFRIPGFDFNQKNIIPGLDLSVKFTSNQLNGREFKLKHHDNGEYEILFDENEGFIIPGTVSFIPANDDKIILFNIKMPDEYTASAESKLEEALDKEIEKRSSDRNTYTFNSNPVAFYNDGTRLRAGHAVTYTDGVNTLSTRVLSVETKLDYACEQNITIGEESIKGNTQTLKEEIVNVNKDVNVIKTLNDLSTNITNAYGRAQKELAEGLAKWGRLWVLRKTESGEDYAFTDLPVVSSSGISALGYSANSGEVGSGGASTFGGLLNVGDWADTIYHHDMIAYKPADGSHWQGKVLSEIVGLDKAALAQYLTANNYARKSDIPLLVGYATESWVKEEGFLTNHQSLAGYATESWTNNKLSGYVTTSRLNELVGGASSAFDTLKEIEDYINSHESVTAGLIASLGNKVDKTAGYGLSKNDFTDGLKVKLDGIEAGANKYALPTASGSVLGGVKIGSNINIANGVISTHAPYELTKEKILSVLRDANGLIYLDADLAVSGGLSSLVAGPGIDLPGIYNGLPIDGTTIGRDAQGRLTVIGGTGMASVRVKLGNMAYDSMDGVVSLPAYPTSLPASDVQPWAKTATKPGYSYSEITGTPPAADLSNYVTLNTAQTITSSKTFTVTQFLRNGGYFGSTNQGILHADGNVTAVGFYKVGGTASQFLKANGSVDSNTYAYVNYDFRLTDINALGYGYVAQKLPFTGPAMSFGTTAYYKTLSSPHNENRLAMRTVTNNVSGTWREFAFQDWVTGTALANYITTNTTQTIGGTKTFTTTIYLNHTAIADSAESINFYTKEFGAKPVNARRLLLSADYGLTSSVPDEGLYAAGTLKANAFIKHGSYESQLLRADGGIATFSWDGNSGGQPTWLWGGNTKHSYTLYNPTNFNVYSSALLRVEDIRDTNPAPKAKPNMKVSSWFNHTGTPNTDWWSGISVTGWNDVNYERWEIAGPATASNTQRNLCYRSGQGSTWGVWKTILDHTNWTYAIDGRYLPLTGGTLTGNVNINTSTGGYLTIQRNGVNIGYFGQGSSTDEALHITNYIAGTSLSLFHNRVLQYSGSINIQNPISGNYMEGIRIGNSSAGWSNMQFGTNGTSTGLNPDGNQWLVGKNPNGQFLICPNASGATIGLTLSRDSNKTGIRWYDSPIWMDSTAKDNASQLFQNAKSSLDLRSYDSNIWYPCWFMPSVYSGTPTRFVIMQGLQGNKPAWATHTGGFSLLVDMTCLGSGWGTNTQFANLTKYMGNFGGETAFGGTEQNTMASHQIVWLRGGGVYYYWSTSNAVLQSAISGYSWVSSTYSYSAAPRTTQNSPYTGFNTDLSYNNHNVYGKLMVDSLRTNMGSTSISLAIGDNGTGFDWVSGGVVRFMSNSTQIANWNSSSFYFDKPAYAPSFTANGYLISVNSGQTVKIGSQNGSYCHYETTALTHYFNKQIQVSGNILPYTGGLQLGVNDIPWGSIFTNDWFRAKGNCGLYFQDWGGGWHMDSGIYIKAYNAKAVHTANTTYYAFNSAGGYYSSRNTALTDSWANCLTTTNAIFNSDQMTVGAKTIRPILSWADSISGVGYVTRYSIGSGRDTSGWGWIQLSVGNNDAGTSGHLLKLYGSGYSYWSGDFNTQGTIKAIGSLSSDNRIYCGWDSAQTGAISCNNWFRSSGQTGWINASYGGGIYMADDTWVRIYNGKRLLVENVIRASVSTSTGCNGFGVSNQTYSGMEIYQGDNTFGIGVHSNDNVYLWGTYAGSVNSSAEKTYFGVINLLNKQFDWYGNFISTGGVTALGASDARLKEGFVCGIDYREKLLLLGPVMDYRYNEQAFQRGGGGVDNNRHTGLIYQNAQKAGITNFCFEDADGYGSLNWLSPDLLATVVGAVQLNIIGMESIEKRTERLERELEGANNRIKELERRLTS